MVSSTRQLVRNFAIGFVLGAIAITASLAHDMPRLSDQVVPPANAAEAQ